MGQLQGVFLSVYYKIMCNNVQVIILFFSFRINSIKMSTD